MTDITNHALTHVHNQVFHDYMVGQQDQYNDRCIDFDVDSLMDLALNKYKMLIESSKWNLPAARDPKVDAQIIALTTIPSLWMDSFVGCDHDVVLLVSIK